MTATTRRALGATVAALLVGGTMALLAVVGDDGSVPGAEGRPDLPLLAEEPLPDSSGSVALVRGGGVRCVSVVEVASGASRDLRCERDLGGDRPRWTAEGDLEVIRHDSSGSELLVLDAEHGAVLDRRLVDRGAILGDDASQRRSARDGRRLVVGADDERTWLEVVTPSGGTERVITVAAGSWQGFRTAAWSPDERFALVEGHDAVYLVEVSTGEARVLADAARNAAWRPAEAPAPAEG